MTEAYAPGETVRRFYEARGDRTVIDAVMAQDVVWDITPGFPNAAIYEGLEAVLGFLKANAESFTSLAAVPERFLITGEGHVVVLGHYSVTAKDGRHDDVRFQHLWTFRGNMIVRLDHVADTSVLGRLHQPDGR